MIKFIKFIFDLLKRGFFLFVLVPGITFVQVL